MATLEQRVSRLEDVLERFIEQSSALFAALHEEVTEIRASNARTDNALLRLWQEFDARWKEVEQRAEMDRLEFNARWKKFEQQAEKDRQQAEIDRQASDERWKKFEQQAEKDRQQAEINRQQAEKEHRDFNKRMAEISDRVGRFVEDMVHPNATRIARQLFGDDPIETLAIRVKRRHPSDSSRMLELDLLVAGKKYLLIGEAKSTPTVEKTDAFLDKVKDIPAFFPEYADRKVLPLMASISFEPSLLAYFTRKKLCALGFGDETMEILNENAW